MTEMSLEIMFILFSAFILQSVLRKVNNYIKHQIKYAQLDINAAKHYMLRHGKLN
jgi:hypothetical protein